MYFQFVGVVLKRIVGVATVRVGFRCWGTENSCVSSFRLRCYCLLKEKSSESRERARLPSRFRLNFFFLGVTVRKSSPESPEVCMPRRGSAPRAEAAILRSGCFGGKFKTEERVIDELVQWRKISRW